MYRNHCGATWKESVVTATPSLPKSNPRYCSEEPRDGHGETRGSEKEKRTSLQRDCSVVSEHFVLMAAMLISRPHRVGLIAAAWVLPKLVPVRIQVTLFRQGLSE